MIPIMTCTNQNTIYNLEKLQNKCLRSILKTRRTTRTKDILETLQITSVHDRAKQLATQIYDAGSWYNDDEGAIYSALEEAGSADNLSLISRMFSAMKYGSLAEYITYYLDDADEVARVKDILESY